MDLTMCHIHNLNERMSIPAVFLIGDPRDYSKGCLLVHVNAFEVPTFKVIFVGFVFALKDFRVKNSPKSIHLFSFWLNLCNLFTAGGFR